MNQNRLSSGISGLDVALGGGFLPGTLVVVVGSTGIGKTQLGIQFANQGKVDEGNPGVFFDMSSRGDSQNHDNYAKRICDWELRLADPKQVARPDGFFDADRTCGDYLHVFDYSGRRVTRDNLDEEGWRDWQAEVAKKLGASVGFFYGNFIRGVRRAVVDGIEPVDRPNDSIQIELFDYIYHQILRKDPEWVARDFFREHYRKNEAAVTAHSYDPKQVVCLLLYTSHETTLEGLLERPLDDGDLLSNANTILYMGKIRDGMRFRRALYVAKHRGSACSDEILPYEIDDAGVRIVDS